MQGYELTERGKVAIAGMIVLALLVLSAILMGKAIANQSSIYPDNQDSEDTGSLVHSPAGSLSATTNSAPSNGGNFTPPEAAPPNMAPQGTAPPDASEPGTAPQGTAPPDASEPGTTPQVSAPPDASEPGTTPQGSAPPEDTRTESQSPGVTPTDNSSEPGYGAPSDGSENGSEQKIPPGAGPIGGNPSEGTLSFAYFPGLQDELDDDTIALLGDLLNSPKNTRNSIITVETPLMSDADNEKLLTAVADALKAYGIAEQRITHSMRQNGIEGGVAEVSLYIVPVNEK